MDKDDAVKALTDLPDVERIEVVRLHPGDVLVVEVQGHVPAESWARIKANLKTIWPNNEIVCCADGAKLRIVRSEDL